MAGMSIIGRNIQQNVETILLMSTASICSNTINTARNYFMIIRSDAHCSLFIDYLPLSILFLCLQRPSVCFSIITVYQQHHIQLFVRFLKTLFLNQKPSHSHPLFNHIPLTATIFLPLSLNHQKQLLCFFFPLAFLSFTYRIIFLLYQWIAVFIFIRLASWHNTDRRKEGHNERLDYSFSRSIIII